MKLFPRWSCLILIQLVSFGSRVSWLCLKYNSSKFPKSLRSIVFNLLEHKSSVCRPRRKSISLGRFSSWFLLAIIELTYMRKRIFYFFETSYDIVFMVFVWLGTYYFLIIVFLISTTKFFFPVLKIQYLNVNL